MPDVSSPQNTYATTVASKPHDVGEHMSENIQNPIDTVVDRSLDTALIHLGRRTSIESHSVNPPLVRASTTIFQTLADFKDSYKGVVFESPRYGRSGTSTNFELQDAMAQLCNAETCIATPSGLGAIAAVIGSHARVGGQILVQEGLYGPTQMLCKTLLETMDCRLEYFHNSDSLEEKITRDTSLIFVEIPSSLTMCMIDIPAVCSIAAKHNIPVACDSTWGTPIYFDAHKLGVSISIHAATKYISGHSDVMLGLITGSYEALSTTRAWCDRNGSHVSADSCWLALRGMRTLHLRMPRHTESAIRIASWLSELPSIKRVLFPALQSDPGHELWQKQFTGAPGPFSVELKPCNEESFEQFINSLRLFGLGTSWGGYESLVMPAVPHHLRALTVQPDEGRIVRFHVGLESPTDLCNDLHRALKHIA